MAGALYCDVRRIRAFLLDCVQQYYHLVRLNASAKGLVNDTLLWRPALEAMAFPASL